MAFSFLNRCIWTPASSGTGDFVVSAAASNGYTPAQCANPAVVDGGTYHYFAINGTQHEEGDGVYTVSTTTLTRATIRNSSTGSKVSFSSAPIVFMGGPVSGDMPQKALANMIFAVPGTYATIQAAANAAASYDYQNTYTAKITAADGTYAVNGSSPAVTLYALTNYPQGLLPTLTGNTTTPANVVISNTLGDAIYVPGNSSWNIEGIRAKSTSGTNCDLNIVGSLTQTNKIDLAGSGKLISVTAGSFNAINQSINVSSAAFTYAFWGFTGGYIVTDGATITFPGGGAACSQYACWLADYSVFGNPTFVNANLVTGNKFWIGNQSVIEYLGTVASFPGNATAFVWAMSQYCGDDGVRLTDVSGNLDADYNVTNASAWTFKHQIIVSDATAGVSQNFIGGHNVAFLVGGSSGSLFGLTNGQAGFIDFSTGSYPLWWDATPNVTFAGVIGITGTTGSYSNGTPDVGLSRLGAGSFAIGNGTAGDTTGSITLEDVILTPLTVATLPAASSALKGARAFVTDELAAVAFNTVATGGGTHNVPVFCDGTTWRIG